MLLGKLRVRQKLVLLVLPLLLLVLAGAVPLVVGRVDAAGRSAADSRAVERAVRISALIEALQLERISSLTFLNGERTRSDLEVRSRTTLSLAQQLGTDYGSGDDQLSAVLRSVSYRSGLAGTRLQVADRRATGIVAYTGYTEAITGLVDLLGVRDRADRTTSVGRQQLALDAIVRHDEALAAAGSALFVEPGSRVTVRVVGLVSAARAVQTLQENVFVRLADPATVELYQQFANNTSSTRLAAYLDSLVAGPTGLLDETVRPDLLARVEVLIKQSRAVGTRVASQAVREADDLAARDRRLAALGVVVAVLLLLAAAVLSVLVTRSIVRPLRRLTESADEVADVAQQELVRVADTDDPEAAVPQLRPIRVGTTDELGELAQAFNRVQQVAAELVERQLVSRRNVATMFGNVGRRTQNLVGRQLAMIDSLERNEQDPALLDRLYRLDHVSTRLRRNANSLVVLSGATDQQITGEPLSVADTIRSALGEIEGFQRVRLAEVDGAVLTPHVTPDITLLLAELLENGTSFSPPHTEVEVDAQSMAEGDVVIRIVDHGLGMTPEQLAAENGRLVSRERLDLAPTDVLGLFVVGRLARRHGIEVLLAPTPGTGVTAEVRVPARHVVRAERPAAAAAPAKDGRGWWDAGSSGTGTAAVSWAKAPARVAPGGSGAAGTAAPLPSRVLPPAEVRPSRGGRSNGNGVGPTGTGARPSGNGGSNANGGPNGSGPGRAGAGPAARPDGAAPYGAAPDPAADSPAPDAPAPAGPVVSATSVGVDSRAGRDAGPAVGNATGTDGPGAQVHRLGSGGATRWREPDADEHGLAARLGLAGIVRRVRGAQLPETQAPLRPGPPTPPPSAADARRSIEDFEAGVRRALRDTGADGSGPVGNDVAPWSVLDPGDLEGAAETRARVEDFEDGVRRALARLDEVAARPAPEPGTLFQRPKGPVPALRRSTEQGPAAAGRSAGVEEGPGPATARAGSAGSAAADRWDRTETPGTDRSDQVPGRADQEARVDRTDGAVPLVPRRLDAGGGSRRRGRTDRPLDRADPAVLFLTERPDLEVPGGDGQVPDDGDGRAGAGPERSGPSAGGGAAGGAAGGPAGGASGGAGGGAGDGRRQQADPRPLERRRGTPDSGPGVSGSVRRIGTNGLPDRRRAVDPGPSGPERPAGPGGAAGPDGATGRAGSPGPDGAAGGTGPDGLANLVRRVPGAQFPAGARAATPVAPQPGSTQPGSTQPGPADAGPVQPVAEQDAAAAARALVEEFEAGVQRALRDGDDRRTAETDEEDAR